MNKVVIDQFFQGIVKIGGIWRSVFGRKIGYGFYYILNGKLDIAFDGNFYIYSFKLTKKEIDSEVIRLNISELVRARKQ